MRKFCAYFIEYHFIRLKLFSSASLIVNLLLFECYFPPMEGGKCKPWHNTGHNLFLFLAATDKGQAKSTTKPNNTHTIKVGGLNKLRENRGPQCT